MNTQLAAPTAQGYFRRILREVKLWDAIVLGILPAMIQPFVAHSLSVSADWRTNVVAAVVTYGIFFVAYCFYMIAKATVKILHENSEDIRNLREFKATNSEKRIFFFSSGMAVSLRRSMQGQEVLVYLHILSTAPTELVYIRLDLTDSTGLRITCEHSEPLTIEKFEITAKMIEQKITAQELEKFQKGMQVNLQGYAKFRDGDKTTQHNFTLTTIPNI
ncbi:MAG TPA: hypothetical protein VK722_11415 [Candidatus Aquilonibacter sp.]|nr:hypothetical protein [Candidatus Aquilonibacter sp.]